jgi:raffinose/stachyose/melibiose transport system substrate-binding protein
MRENAPTPANKQAQAFFKLTQVHETDILWELPEGLPDGNQIMQDSAIDVLKGRIFPNEAARALQSGMAQWFEPAQNCTPK